MINLPHTNMLGFRGTVTSSASFLCEDEVSTETGQAQSAIEDLANTAGRPCTKERLLRTLYAIRALPPNTPKTHKGLI